VNTPGRPRSSNIDGLPQAAINITLDGASIQDNYLKTSDGFFTRLQPRLDAVEEVTVTSAANGADTGGQGAVQIQFTTRSGSNEFHGSVYHYYKNDGLNSNTWFNNRDLPPGPNGKAPRARKRDDSTNQAVKASRPRSVKSGPIRPPRICMIVTIVPRPAMDSMGKRAAVMR